MKFARRGQKGSATPDRRSDRVEIDEVACESLLQSNIVTRIEHTGDRPGPVNIAGPKPCFGVEEFARHAALIPQ